MHKAAILALLALGGCGAAAAGSEPRPPDTVQGTRDLQTYHDNKRGVTCWRVEGFDGISCLPDSALKEPE